LFLQVRKNPDHTTFNIASRILFFIRFILVGAGLRDPPGSLGLFLSPHHLSPLGHDLPVSGVSLLGVVGPLDGGGPLGALPLNADGGDQPLDLGGLGPGLVLVVGGQLLPDDELGDVVVLLQVEEGSDLGGALGAEGLVEGVLVGVGLAEAGEVGLALADDDAGDGGHAVVVHAAADGLPLALALAAGSVAGLALLHEEADSVVGEDTLLHGETLLVGATGEADDVAFVLFAKGVEGHLVGDPLVEDVLVLVLILDFDAFLLARGRVGGC